MVVDWLRMSTDTRLSWNDFIDSGAGFATLDLKLAEGLLAHFRDDRNNNNHHSQHLFRFTQEQLNGYDRLSRGRQVLNSIWHELTSGVCTTTIFTWFTLANVQLHGNDLGGFQVAWFSVLNEIEQRPDEPSHMEMFLTQLRNTSIMNADLQYFDNSLLAHVDRSYAWMVAVVQKHVLQHKEKQLVHEYTRQAGQPSLTFPNSGRQSHAPPAAPFTRGRSITRRGISPRRSTSPGGRKRKFTPRG